MTELRMGGANPAAIMAWQRAIVKFAASYARKPNGEPLGVDGWIGYDDAKVAAEYRSRRKLPPPPPGVVVTAEEYGALVKGGPTSPPAPPRARHKALVFRGTGGIIGEDYVSRVCQGAADLVEERNPAWQAGMGGIPVGAGTTPQDLSMQRAVDAAVDAGSREIESGGWSFVLGGYSAGAIVASLLRLSLEPGGRLAPHRGRFVAGFTFGNPYRTYGHTYLGGSVPTGQGIGDQHLTPQCNGPEWFDAAQEADMYANVPRGKTGEIMTDAYGLITHTQLTDMMGTVKAMLPYIIEIMGDAGIGLPLIGKLGTGMGAGGLAGLIPMLLPILISMLPGLIGGIGTPNEALTDQAAAVQAAIIAMKFVIAGTGPHITYHSTLAPGSPFTYLDLATRHVRDWAARTPVRN